MNSDDPSDFDAAAQPPPPAASIPVAPPAAPTSPDGSIADTVIDTPQLPAPPRSPSPRPFDSGSPDGSITYKAMDSGPVRQAFGTNSLPETYVPPPAGTRSKIRVGGTSRPDSYLVDLLILIGKVLVGIAALLGVLFMVGLAISSGSATNARNILPGTCLLQQANDDIDAQDCALPHDTQTFALYENTPGDQAILGCQNLFTTGLQTRPVNPSFERPDDFRVVALAFGDSSGACIAVSSSTQLVGLIFTD